MLVMCASRYSRARRENSGARRFKGKFAIFGGISRWPAQNDIHTNKGDIHANAA